MHLLNSSFLTRILFLGSCSTIIKQLTNAISDVWYANVSACCSSVTTISQSCCSFWLICAENFLLLLPQVFKTRKDFDPNGSSLSTLICDRTDFTKTIPSSENMHRAHSKSYTCSLTMVLLHTITAKIRVKSKSALKYV